MLNPRNMPSEEDAVRLLEKNGARCVEDAKFQIETERYVGTNGPLRGKLFEFPDADTAREAISNLISRAPQKQWTPHFERLSPTRLEFIGIASSIGLQPFLLDPGPVFGLCRYFCYNETTGENLGVIQFPLTENEGRDLDLLEELFSESTGNQLGYALRKDDEF
ncbi:hypothetical protein EBR25_13960 [bacterium]|nr:hypothetical protein [bacterium]